jgi:membrane protein
VNRDAGWHRTPLGVIRRTFEAAVEDNIPFLASALSFDLLLTALPFVVLLLAAVGYLVQHQITTRQLDVHELLERLLPLGGSDSADMFRHAEAALSALVRARGRLTLLGVPLFLWFSSRLFGGLRVALNEVFDSDENRPWPVAKLTDLSMVFITALLLFANAGLPALKAQSAAALGDGFLVAWLYRFSLELVAFGFSTGLFFLIFEILPSRRLPWRTALVSAVFCALAFEVGKRLYALYLARFVTLDRVASDANLVALFLFLLWVYGMAYAFLLSCEVAEVVDLIRLRRAQRVGLG